MSKRKKRQEQPLSLEERARALLQEVAEFRAAYLSGDTPRKRRRRRHPASEERHERDHS
jgi:hypothetical protein